MVKDDHARGTPQQRARAEAHGPMFRTAAVALTVVSLAAATGFLMARWLREPVKPLPPAAAPELPGLFQDWPKPDLALVLSGQQHGYLQPCGCSRPQFGGLARRWNFLQALRERGWPVAAVDGGDIAQTTGPQALLKYVLSMNALNLMGYGGVGVGLHEMSLELFRVLAEYALNNPSPAVLAANLLDKDGLFKPMVKPWHLIAEKGAPRVGVVGVVADSVAQKSPDNDAKFAPVDQVLPNVLRALDAQKPELLVLLLQGSLEEARACAGKYPQFHVILCLSREDEPPGQADRVGNTLLVRIGHKGRYVGVVGVQRTSQRDRPFELRYELVRLGEEYETPEGQDAKNPIYTLLDNHAKTVRDRNLLASYPRSTHPLQVEYPNAVYVGSAKCKSCHKQEYKIWEASGHSHAYDTLAGAKRPALRQYDGECVVCHVTGFQYKSGFASETTTAHLKHVGCESCHGPGSLHVADQTDAKLNALMNPWRAKENENAEARKRRLHQIDQSCQQCHDKDNDVHWDFDKKWPKVDHTRK